MPTTLDDLTAIRESVGKTLGQSEWHLVDQDTINRFADATGDHQWIHVDVERAKTESPFGTTIAHGYLTLSMMPVFIGETVRFGKVSMVLNYGCNKVRFPSPVKVNSRLRATTVLTSVEEVAGGIQIVLTVTVEAAGETKPVCVAETVSRVYA